MSRVLLWKKPYISRFILTDGPTGNGVTVALHPGRNTEAMLLGTLTGPKVIRDRFETHLIESVLGSKMAPRLINDGALQVDDNGGDGVPEVVDREADTSKITKVGTTKTLIGMPTAPPFPELGEQRQGVPVGLGETAEIEGDGTGKALPPIKETKPWNPNDRKDALVEALGSRGMNAEGYSRKQMIDMLEAWDLSNLEDTDEAEQ